MIRSLSKAALLVALSCTPLMHAQNNPSQTPSVDFGRSTVQLNSAFVNTLTSLGAVVTDLHGNPMQNNSFTLNAVAGAIDLTTSAGEIEHAGGLLISVAGTTLRIQNFTLDTSNPTAPVLSAAFIINDHFAGRTQLFNVQPPAGFSLPLVPQAGVLQVNGLSLTLNAAAATLLNNLFGAPVLSPGLPIGTGNVYVVLAAAN
jgi:hypothetical protein